jgi:hypothetical protein
MNRAHRLLSHVVAGTALPLLLCALTAQPLAAQHYEAVPLDKRGSLAALDTLPGFIWAGSDSLMTTERLAAYAAPILWFSPDEPNLAGKTGKAIRIPEAFPFETAPDAPVSYYMVRTIFHHDESAGWSFRPDSAARGQSTLNLAHVDAVDLDYFFYYASEQGLGGHKHDVESTQMKLVVYRQPSCTGCEFALVLPKVIGKAHGMQWYDNTLVVDQGAKFPMRILVEEGKHASCTDKNGDGYYTPGYDVNRRINDAWGVRDVISSGALFSGGWQSWMAKVRQEQDRVMPPLPEDSPLRGPLTVDGVYAPDNAIYELRPFPPATEAEPDLVHFIADKGDPNWPVVKGYGDAADPSRWLEDQDFSKSLSIAYRYDGQGGVAAAFPLFIVKNFEVSLTGGWLLNRVYIETDRWAWTLLYTSSASNWIGSYFSGGLEWDDVRNASDSTSSEVAYFVGELGMKFRVNMVHTPAKFLAKITDFWGVRTGVKATGGFDIKQLSYVIEVGAGTF